MSQPEDLSTGRVLLTGATGFIGRRIAEALLLQGRELILLSRPSSAAGLQRWIDQLEHARTPGGRPTVVLGDLAEPELGLTVGDRDRIRESVTEVIHAAARYDLGMSTLDAQVNVDGTRRMLTLAETIPKLCRFHHISTMAVAGDFQGTYREDDFDVGQAFEHAYGRSKFLAESLVRERMRNMPVTIYRPGVVVGDSKSGAIDKVDGPYYLFRMLRKLREIPGLRYAPMIVPNETDRYFHMVPVDFVVDALIALGRSEESLGRTYHLMDPEPLSYGEFYRVVLREMGFRGPTLGRPLARSIRLLKTRPLWGPSRALGRVMGVPAELLLHYMYRITYDTTQCQRDLRQSGITCPSLQSYLPLLIQHYLASNGN